MKRTSLLLTCAAALVSLLPLTGWADSISPSSLNLALEKGESVTIRKTATITQEVSNKVDVFFLADTTGSMGGPIAAVKASATTILSDIAGLGDVAFGVGEYKGEFDAFKYRRNTDITAVQATAQAGINLWGASGGADYPESNLFALESVSNDTSWRPDSTRILVWFGDAPGHDPTPGTASTEATATEALVAKGINVQAVNVAPTSWDEFAPFGGIDYGLNDTGQAKRIADATGGALYNGIDSSTIVDKIKDAITSVFETYSQVFLDTSAAPAGVSVSVLPGVHEGSFDRSITRTFDFDVTFTGVDEGSYTFDIVAKTDKFVVGPERDTIRVTGGGPGVIPEPGTMLLLGSGLLGLAAHGRKRRAK